MGKFFQRSGILLLGDSITQLSFSASLSGWGAHIGDVYQRRADVYNRGFSGYNTDWILRYLESDEGFNDVFSLGGDRQKNGNDGSTDGEEGHIKLMTIFFGANDASDEKLNPRQHVPLSRFQSNLRQLADLSKKNFGEKIRIIFITPPPVCHAKRLVFQKQRYKEKATGDLERTLELSGKYAKAVQDVAEELGYPCLNLWEEMQQSSGEEKKTEGEESLFSKYLNDGLHLSQEGNIFVGQKLVQVINKSYPELCITPCPITGYHGNSASKAGEAITKDASDKVGPWHDEIDEESFCARKRAKLI